MSDKPEHTSAVQIIVHILVPGYQVDCTPSSSSREGIYYPPPPPPHTHYQNTLGGTGPCHYPRK